MKEAVNFLTQVYYDSVADVAAIKVAEADNDRETIEKYLMYVHNYTGRLINQLKKDGKNEKLSVQALCILE